MSRSATRRNLEDALWKVEQRLAHIRENLATRQLAEEFEQAHQLRKSVPPKEPKRELKKSPS